MMESTSEMAKREFLSWPVVTALDHRYGGLEFRVNGGGNSHLHGDLFADTLFQKDVGKKLIAEGKVSPTNFLPGSGCVSFYINTPTNIPELIDLFRMQYDSITRYGKKKVTGVSSYQTL